MPIIRAPTLVVQSNGSFITLTWDRPGFTLQASDVPDGLWIDVSTTAENIFVAPVSAENQFYRLREAVR